MATAARSLIRFAAWPLVVVAAATMASAQLVEGVPAELQGVGIEQKPDNPLPLELEFVDEQGRTVTLASYIGRGKPVLLNLVYYRCPMLCSLVLSGVVDALKPLDWTPGNQFEIVTVSIDPLETPQLALHKQESYVQSYGRPEAAAGWHFLTGKQPEIDALAEAVGFRYRYLPERQEYAHSAALIVVTPAGRISRYLLGVLHDPRTLRLSLVEASEGKIGSMVDQFVLYCYSYDSQSGRYTPVAWKIMRIGGVLTALILASTLILFWLREARHKRTA